MTDQRIIDLSYQPARLRVSLERLVIQRSGHEDTLVPLSEVAVLILCNRQITVTQSVLGGLMCNGATVVACDGRSMPVGMMLPLANHHLQAERFAKQAQASEPTRKRVWQQIVRAKIRAQAHLLRDFRNTDGGLLRLAEEVRSGDPSNVEAQASRRYWKSLFDDASFRRNREAEDQNRLLNYGYGVLRAIVARAVCSAGLHPSVGLHHHNRYDAFCLADDLMEPYRVVVDRAVLHVVLQYGPQVPLDTSIKGNLIRALLDAAPFQGERRSIFDCAARTASSLAHIYLGETKTLLLPEF